jgi:hypothetical protein
MAQGKYSTIRSGNHPQIVAGSFQDYAHRVGNFVRTPGFRAAAGTATLAAALGLAALVYNAYYSPTTQDIHDTVEYVRKQQDSLRPLSSPENP